MFLEYQKVRTKNYYKIGYCSEWNEYLLVLTVTYVGYYDQYYIIKKEEYDLWKDNVEKLDVIAEECRKTNIHSKRFLCSGMPQENTREQLEILFSEVVRREYNPNFEKI